MIVLVQFIFFDLAITYFHPLAVKTARFCKTAYDEVHLTFQALTSEVKPRWWSVGIGLLVHLDQVSVLSLELRNLSQTARLKIALKDRITNLDDFPFICVHTAFLELGIMACSLIFLDSLEWLHDIERKLLLYIFFGPEGISWSMGLSIDRKWVSEEFIMMGLELISALLSVHYFILSL